MNIGNVVKILNVLRLLGQMPMVGEGSTRPTIIFYSGVPQSTVHRYLEKLEKLKLVSATYIENRNCQQVSYWKITELGQGYILKDERII